MIESLIDDFFLTMKEEWQDGFEGQYRHQLEGLLLLLNKDLKGNDIEEYLKGENLFVTEKFLSYILKNGKIKGGFKSNAKRALSFITSRDITSRDYDERIAALGEEHAIKTYWDPEDESNRRRIEVISNAIEVKRGEVIIDIGCGVGTFTYRMALKGGKAIGVDYSLASLKLAQSLAKRKFKVTAKTHFVAADATYLPFHDSSADAIVAADFIEHINDIGKERLLAEAARVLSKNGRMIIFTPNKLRESIGTIIRWFKGEEDTRLHFGLSTRFAFEKKLKKKGFKYKRLFVDVVRPFLATIPIMRELLALEILWVARIK
jgi:ubiquinone/menaquinone biosynthesis C-methylase UbiE